jgi:hypothetical protein
VEGTGRGEVGSGVAGDCGGVGTDRKDGRATVGGDVDWSLRNDTAG